MIRTRRPKILLFDIDGTLVLTGGAGVRAMTRAFEEVFGRGEGFGGVPIAGRTDSAILADALATARIDADRHAIERFRVQYIARLAEEIEQPSAGKRVLPGIADILTRLESEPHVFRALLTGNYSDAARVKLGHFDLWRYFTCGAFGEEAHERTDLVPIALARARACGAPPVDPSDVVVIGDTPHDVRCAVVAGARSIAVATGHCDRATLESTGADVVFDDLSDTAAFLTQLD